MRQLCGDASTPPTSGPAAGSSGHALPLPRASQGRLASVVDTPMLTRLIPLSKLDDGRLTARIGEGDAAAFAALYDRHHAPLLAFCRHMLGNRQDGEDALQQTFIRAHRAMLSGRRPDEPRAWLFAIARNRCRTMLAARADTVVNGEEQLERVSVEGLTAEVQQRAELRELLADMARLPEDQRAAVLLTELRGFSHEQIAVVLGCPPQKVKALVFQARTHLLAEREARDTGCVEIREQLEIARGADLRRGVLRRHLRRCEPCKTYSLAVAAQRTELAGLMAVLPSAGLKASVLGAVGVMGGKGAASGVAGGGAAGVAGGGYAASGSAAGGVSVSAAAGGVVTKLAVIKVAAVLAASGVAAGGATAIVSRSGQGAERGSVQSGQEARTHTASTPGKPVVGRSIRAQRSGPATGRSRLRHQRRRTRSRGARAGSGAGGRTGKLARLRRAKDGRAGARRAGASGRRKGTGTAGRRNGAANIGRPTGGGKTGRRTGAPNAGRRKGGATARRRKGVPNAGRRNSGATAGRRRAGAGAARPRAGERRRHRRDNPRPRRPHRPPPVTTPAPQPSPPPTAGSPAEPRGTAP
jgi:RNA polymerase sigma factor (sigma-70 family)